MDLVLHALLLSLLLKPFILSSSYFSLSSAAADENFDVRRHLSTVTRYEVSKVANVASFVSSTISKECTPVHLNLVARHGTRSPTKKRIKELDQLSIYLNELINHAKQVGDSHLPEIPSWLFGWQSPWKGRQKGGELIRKGEEELYHLAVRVREKFPELFKEEYHPEIITLRATQVPRASASAVAFGMGLFSGNGTLGPGKHRAFSVVSESRASDICLRFYDTCETYKEYRKSQEPFVDMLKEPILEEITAKLVKRYQLNFTRQHVASLWFLCKQEASLLDITNQACGLFTASDVELLEWTDDMELFVLKGYGKSLNYRMAVPLLRDVVESMEQTISAKEENLEPQTLETARLRFAHAETVVPFTCLLGFFLEGPAFEQTQREEPLELPPRPPHHRHWRGSTVAPFGGNTMLVLFHCSGNISQGSAGVEEHSDKYFVQVLHNEVPVPMPGCGNKDFCPFKVFKERIVDPHLKHNFELVCTLPTELPELSPGKVPSLEKCSIACRLASMIRRFFLRDSSRDSRCQRDEL